MESMDITEVDNGTSDVAAVEADGAIHVNEGPVFELDTVAPECDGAIWVSDDGPGGFEGCDFAFLSNPFESIDMFDKRSAASSVSFPLPTSPGRPLFHLAPRLLRYCPSAAHRTRFTPLPINLAHPKSQFVQHWTRGVRRRWGWQRLGTVYRDGLGTWCLVPPSAFRRWDRMIDSTSSMQNRTFSGLRSV